MKKQISLIALSTILIAFTAFSGVASAQASNVQVRFFYSPYCSVCEQVKPLVENATAQTGVKLIEYNVSTSPGDRIAQSNGVNGTPTIVIQGGGTLRGNVTEPQINTAIQAAVSNVQVRFFYSPYCSVCEQVKPLVENATAQTGVKLIEYNVSTSPGDRIAQSNGVNGTPTIVIQGGGTLRGNVTEPQINTAIQAAVDAATPTPKTTNTTTNATTNATPTPNVPEVSSTPRTPSMPAPATPLVAASKLKHSSEVAASSTEKPQSSPSPTNTTQAAAEAKELNAGPANCSAPLSPPTSLGSASQKCFACTPSLQVPADSSNASAAASAISAEASALSQNGSVPGMTLPEAQTSSAASLPGQSVFEFSLLGLGAPTLLVGLLYLLLRRV